MKSSFIFVYYLYNYYMVCVLSSHTPHVTWSCDIPQCDCDTCDMTLSCTSYVVSPKEKEKVSQKVTYWFVIWYWNIQKGLESEF